MAAADNSEVLGAKAEGPTTELVLRGSAPGVAAAMLAAAPLATLEVLDLSDCHLEELPPIEWRTALPRLRSLDVSRNRLKTLPTDLPPSLMQLALQHNLLTTVPEGVFRLTALTKLLLGGNRLTTLEGQFAGLRALRMLYAGCNEITTLSEDLAGVAATLQVLYLGGNRLTQLPPVVASLTELVVVNLSHNGLESLSSDVAQLQKLTVLHLHKNRLQTLPVELLALRQLRQLSIRDNPLVATFADECAVIVPTLRDLAARAAHRQLCAQPQLAESWRWELPQDLWAYLQSAQSCSSCNGVCFGQSRRSHIEFLDLCGQYHVPFNRFLCSLTCHEERADAARPEADPIERVVRLRRVLLNRYAPGDPPSLEQLRQEVMEVERELADWAI